MIHLDQSEATISYLAPSSHKHYLITELLIGILTLWNRKNIQLASKRQSKWLLEVFHETFLGTITNCGRALLRIRSTADTSSYLRSCHQDIGIWASSWPCTPWRSACSSQAWPIRWEYYYRYRPMGQSEARITWPSHPLLLSGPQICPALAL